MRSDVKYSGEERAIVNVFQTAANKAALSAYLQSVQSCYEIRQSLLDDIIYEVATTSGIIESVQQLNEKVVLSYLQKAKFYRSRRRLFLEKHDDKSLPLSHRGDYLNHAIEKEDAAKIAVRKVQPSFQLPVSSRPAYT
jgi:hypothetical protein